MHCPVSVQFQLRAGPPPMEHGCIAATPAAGQAPGGPGERRRRGGGKTPVASGQARWNNHMGCDQRLAEQRATVQRKSPWRESCRLAIRMKRFPLRLFGGPAGGALRNAPANRAERPAGRPAVTPEWPDRPPGHATRASPAHAFRGGVPGQPSEPVLSVRRQCHTSFSARGHNGNFRHL